MKNIFFYFLLILILAGCNSLTPSKSVVADPDFSNENIKAVLYMQKAAEYRALCYQTFNSAQIMLDNYLRRMNVSKPYAIVVDIDETVLDNSPHAAQSILDATLYPVGWAAWIGQASARAIPGAVEFLSYAGRQGITIFYISNRKEEFRNPTLQNLRLAGFPGVRDETVLLRQDGNGKESRRENVRKTHEIIMLFGDNLNDFLPDFEQVSPAVRSTLTDQYQNEFGRRFFVLPNPSYGDWEGALYEYNHSLTAREKAELKRKHLVGFKTE
ncbi:MAG: 5'-nucleotidase, lipoprotein e(P4) family [Bacteroidales bacterium]|nr:5'-nucleotidase, lipoprotein e(P4) family [Bacteroidales bacterium]MDY0285870.1 5'-nucleotidase, lipoprotein e(P4) family [Bacteroidales bacterium]HPE85724.1 5'-nucleotidase, lipoprotein e(P4) family [Bacteroidales bacterium]